MKHNEAKSVQETEPVIDHKQRTKVVELITASPILFYID